MDRPTFAAVIAVILTDHRIGPTGKPWYLQPGSEGYRADRDPNFEQVYTCKCKQWRGRHAEHITHQAMVITERLAPLLEHCAALSVSEEGTE